MIRGWVAILLPTPRKTSGLYGGISCSQRVGQSNMNGVNASRVGQSNVNGVNASARDVYNARGV